MSDDDKKILKDAGWEVECESPLEIRKGESFASNEAATLVLAYLRDEKYGDGSGPDLDD